MRGQRYSFRPRQLRFYNIIMSGNAMLYSGVARVWPVGPRPYQSRRRSYATPLKISYSEHSTTLLFCASVYHRQFCATIHRVYTLIIGGWNHVQGPIRVLHSHVHVTNIWLRIYKARSTAIA